MRKIFIKRSWKLSITFLILGTFLMNGYIATFLDDNNKIFPSENNSLEFKYPENKSDKEIVNFVENEIIIKFRDEVTVDVFKDQNDLFLTKLKSIDELNKKYNVENIKKISKENSNSQLSNVYKFVFSETTDIHSCIKEYNENPNVEYADYNIDYNICYIPNDDYFDQQWALHQNNNKDINAPEAWDIETGSSEVVIAVIDTGVDYNHPDLDGNIWINNDEIQNNDIDDDGNGYIDDYYGWNFTYDQSNDPIDDCGHGTCCAGIISAETDNSIGIAGVTWYCKIMVIKAFNMTGVGTSAQIAEGINYAVNNGADIISMSFSSLTPEILVKEALDIAYNNNIVLVASRGNKNSITQSWPANYENVISVAGVDQSFCTAEKSSFGSWTDVAAPGEEIITTTPSYQVKNYPLNYGSFSGTSSACPHVAGLAGLLLSKDPFLTPDMILTIIHSSTKAINCDIKYLGTGIIDADKALTLNTHLVAKLNPYLDERFIGRGIIDIYGTAMGSGFSGYKIYWGEGIYPFNWFLKYSSSEPVEDNLLYNWQNYDTSGEGYYTLKLEVSSDSGEKVVDYALLYIDPLLKEGWATYLDTGFISSCPISYDFNDDGKYEIVVGTHGPWTSLYNARNSGWLYILDDEGHIFDEDFPFETEFPIRSRPVIGDLDNDGVMEIVVACDGDVYVLHSDGSLILNKHSIRINGGTPPVLADLDSDGYLEIIKSGWYGKIYAWNLDGSNVDGWPPELPDYGCGSYNYISCPAVADLDDDGDLEVVVNTPDDNHKTYVFNHDGSIHEGWPIYFEPNDSNTSNDIATEIIIADFDGDGDLQVMRQTGKKGVRSKIWIYEPDGATSSGWPQNVGYCRNGYSVGDVDNDGLPEIFIGGDYNGIEYLYGFNGDGSSLLEFPISHGRNNGVQGFCAIANIDTYTDLELITRFCYELGIFKSTTGEEILEVWPSPLDDEAILSYDFEGSGHITDIDGDGYADIIATSRYNAIHAWKTDSEYNWENLEWPMFQHDLCASGYYTPPTPPTNVPPNKPDKPSGQENGYSGKEYTYTTSTTDLNGDQIYYVWDWGDGTNTGWTGPYNSGQEVSEDKSWENPGNYQIKVRAKDVYGVMSEWSDPLPVTMPVNFIFGYSNSGLLYQNLNDKISGTKFNINANSYAHCINAYIKTNSGMNPKAKCMIYHADNSMLIGETEEKILDNGEEEEWVQFNFNGPKPNLIKNTEYVLVCWSNDTCNIFYDEDINNSYGKYKYQNYGDAPSPTISWDDDEARLYSIFCNYSTIPEVKNVSTSPENIGFGYNTTITADIEHYGAFIENINVSITYLNSIVGNFSMIEINNDTYQYIFNDTWIVGQYNYTIWIKDKCGGFNNSSKYSFNVSAQADISVCTIKDEYENNEMINLTDPPITPCLIGYELLDDGEVLRIWNKYDNYYFDTDSGIQLTNHHNEYWSHNVLMLGYYNNNQWNLIYRTDELSGFNKNIETDNETYVNATLWKDLTYAGYDFRLAIRYHLGLDDNELTIIPYIKNLGQDIPYVLGFAWEINDIKIDMTPEGDYIEINNTVYNLNETLDLTFANMTLPVYCWDNTTNETYVCDYTPIPYFYIREDITESIGESLYLRWNDSLNYRVQVKSKEGEYNAPITLGIKIGTLNTGQEKYTEIFWYDASEIMYNFDSYDNIITWASNPASMVDNSTSTFASTTTSFDVELCDGNTCSSTDLGTISKVEVRCHGKRSGSGFNLPDIILRPLGANHVFSPSVTADWSSWYDVTNDPYAPQFWSWNDVDNLNCEVVAKVQPFYTVYCSKLELRVTYTPPNAPPGISNPYPINGATGISIQPVLNITVSDDEDDNMDITWMSNSSGSWQVFGTNNSVDNGTYYQIFSNATVNGQWWYWRVNVSDGSNYTLSSVYRFYTGNESKLTNTGNFSIKGYLLIQVQFFNNSTWVVADDTINETTPRIIKWEDEGPFKTEGQHILGLDTIFNGRINTSYISSFGNGTYRIYAVFRDPEGNVLVCDDETELISTYEFTVTYT